MKKEKESAKLKKYYQKNRDKILQSSNNYHKKHSAEDRETTFKILSSRNTIGNFCTMFWMQINLWKEFYFETPGKSKEML